MNRESPRHNCGLDRWLHYNCNCTNCGTERASNCGTKRAHQPHAAGSKPFLPLAPACTPSHPFFAAPNGSSVLDATETGEPECVQSASGQPLSPLPPNPSIQRVSVLGATETEEPECVQSAGGQSLSPLPPNPSIPNGWVAQRGIGELTRICTIAPPPGLALSELTAPVDRRLLGFVVPAPRGSQFSQIPSLMRESDTGGQIQVSPLGGAVRAVESNRGPHRPGTWHERPPSSRPGSTLDTNHLADRIAADVLLPVVHSRLQDLGSCMCSLAQEMSCRAIGSHSPICPLPYCIIRRSTTVTNLHSIQLFVLTTSSKNISTAPAIDK